MEFVAKEISIKSIVQELKSNDLDGKYIKRIHLKRREKLSDSLYKQQPSIYVIEQGLVKVSKIAQKSKNEFIEILASGDILGIECLTGNHMMPHLTATSLGEVQLEQINIEYLLNYTSNRPSFMEFFLDMLTEVVNRAYFRNNLLRLQRKERFIWGVNELLLRFGEGSDIEGYTCLPSCINKKLLGEYFSMDKNFISKVFQFFKSNNYILEINRKMYFYNEIFLDKMYAELKEEQKD